MQVVVYGNACMVISLAGSRMLVPPPLPPPPSPLPLPLPPDRMFFSPLLSLPILPHVFTCQRDSNIRGYCVHIVSRVCVCAHKYRA
jgi:hypothetical protein